MAYGNFKDLARRTASDKVLKVNAFNIAKNLKHDVHQRGLGYQKGPLHLQMNLLKVVMLLCYNLSN